jgi:Cu/Ag efflux protein CusF
MTMNFKVKERALMQGIKVGDSVAFTFMQSNGDYVLTHIQPSNRNKKLDA